MNAIPPRSARKQVLPTLLITQTTNNDDPDAVMVELPGQQQYAVRQLYAGEERKRSDGKPDWSPFRINLFPVVLCSDSAPWPEANLYLLKSLEENPSPDMRTYDARALDLADFRRFVESEAIDWSNFGASKLRRPTYRYRAHLNLALRAGEVSANTVKRRIGTVVGFYSWLMKNQIWKPEYPPWLDKDHYITSKDAYGFTVSKTVKSTDLTIHVPKQDDPYGGLILDGGYLRPLPNNEQEWLIDALFAASNPEMTLMHLMGMLTGARLQTICTIKLRHFENEIAEDQKNDVRLTIGPGTGIDSKGGKQLVLHIPIWLHEAVRVYSKSERAYQRRIKSTKDPNNQYLFLTKYGNPYYADSEDRRVFNAENKRRYDVDGGAIGTFIRTVIKPHIQRTNGIKEFSFRFHDTRATFGMNLTDHLLANVERGEMSLGEVREFVRTRMGHASAATTDLYLDYRRNLRFVRSVIEEHELHLQKLCERAIHNIL